MTVANAAPDTKPVRMRGPLINSSVGVGTYTVYVRPFFDEVNSLGSADAVQRREHRVSTQRYDVCRHAGHHRVVADVRRHDHHRGVHDVRTNADNEPRSDRG